MSRYHIARLFLFFFLLVAPALAKSDDIQFGLPDSLQALKFWDNSGQFVGKSLSGGPHTIPLIQVIPESDAAGELTLYKINMTLPDGGIPYSGGIALGFPHNFGLGSIISIEYSDNYSGTDLGIKKIFVFNQIVSIFFKKGSSPPAGTIITLTIHSIRSTTHAGSYGIAGIIFNKSIVVVAGPTPSEPFSIEPGPVASIQVIPSDPLNLGAGDTQRFAAVGFDRYGNEISGLAAQWSFAPSHDSIGTITDGFLVATRVGIGQVRATYNSLDGYSGLITVSPGAIDHFGLNGYPQSIEAGVPFPSDVSVTAYDHFGNVKFNYLGSIYFTSSDPQAELFYNNSNKYPFTAVDSGIHLFAGSLFTLNTPGAQTIAVTDGVISRTSDPIQVTSEITEITYVNGSLSPDTVTAGGNYLFGFDLTLSGSKSLDVDSSGTILQLLYGTNLISVPLAGFPIDLSPGNNHLNSAQTLIPGSLGGHILTPRLILKTSDRVDTISFNNDFVQVMPSQPVSLTIDPSGPIEMRVGTTRTFTAIAFDAQGNQIQGLDIAWSMSPSYDSIGVVSGGNFLALNIGKGKIVASYNGLSATSGLITVLPGEIDHFVISGYPQTVIAGASWSTGVTVTAFDQFDNVKFDYSDSIYFTSSDSKAVLNYSRLNKYLFTEADSGVHIFPGTNFRLNTIGFQTISVTDGQHVGTSGAIAVTAGGLASFDITADLSVMAGSPYLISVTKAKDQMGNLANGLVSITLISGGASPKGFAPILVDIYVNQGSGSAEQFLYATGVTVLRAESGGVTHDISVTVTPAELGELKLDIQPTQFLGNPILGPATITCYDKFGNLKSDFDASKTPVELTADTGMFTPAIIDVKENFIDGSADLAKLDIIYEGLGGRRVLAIRIGDVSANSELHYNGTEFEPERTGQLDTIFLGENKVFLGTVFNRGDSIPLDLVVDVSGYFQSCSSTCQIRSIVQSPGPGGSRPLSLYAMTDYLTLDSDDTVRLITTSRYQYENDTIVTRSNSYIPVYVVQGLLLEYVQGSLSIDTIIAPSLVPEISLKFEANKDLTESDLLIRFTPYYYTSNDTGRGQFGDLLGSNQAVNIDGRIITFKFLQIEIPDIKMKGWFDEGYRPLNGDLSVYNRIERSSLIRQLFGFDSAYFAFTGQLAYAPNSIKPKSVRADRASSFEFDINLDGRLNITLDSGLLTSDSAFQLYDEDTTLYLGIVLDSGYLKPGVNHFRTKEIHIPAGLLNDEFTPKLIIGGKELYSHRVDTILFGDERISTSGLPQIRITATQLETVNPPFVNYGQAFSIKVTTTNYSSDTLSNLSVIILAGSTEDTIAISGNHTILPASELAVSIPLVADSISAPAKIYRAAIQTPNAVILPSDNNSIAVTIQSPADISLEFTLVGTYQGYMEYGQPFDLIVRMTNDGEAGASNGEISLSTGEMDFGIPSPSVSSVEPDSAAIWSLTAPPVSGTANLTVNLTNTPIDRNTGLPAQVKIPSLEIPIMIEPSQAELIVNGILAGAPLVIEGSTSQLFELELENNTENSLNNIGIKSINIQLIDSKGNLIAPDLILWPDETHFLEGDQVQAYCEIVDNILRLNFPNFRLEPGAERKVVFSTKFKDKIDVPTFTLKIENTDIRVVFVSGPRLNQPVPVRGKLDNNFRIAGNFTVTPPSLGQSLMVRNNPFNPDIEQAEIAYNLETNTDVTIKVVTLAGEKVYESIFPAGTAGGQKGTNLITWDARNDKGHVVLNGVYVVLIRDSNTGQTYRLKLAVMK